MNIYFREMIVKQQKQDPAYTGWDILSNIGGALGLWAGLSLLTVMEMLLFLGSIFLYFAKIFRPQVQ